MLQPLWMSSGIRIGRTWHTRLARQGASVVLFLSVLAMAAWLVAEDPPAAPVGSAGVVSKQALLERRRELNVAAKQLYAQQQLAELLKCLSQVVEVCRQIDPPGTDSDTVGVLLQTYQEMCRILKIRGDYPELRRVAQEALVSQRAARENDLSDACDSAVFMLELGIAEVETAAYDSACSTLRAAREELRTIEGEDRTEGVDLLDARICRQLANAEFRPGHLQAADQYFSDAVDVARAACARFGTIECRRQLAAGLFSRARALRLGGKSGRAASIAAEACELSGMTYFMSRSDADAASTLQSQVLLGAITRDNGDNLGAREILEGAMVKAEGSLARLPSTHSHLEEALLALLAIAIDRKDIAEQHYLRNRIIQLLSNSGIEVASPLLRLRSEANRYLGRSFHMTGDLCSAETQYLTCLRLLENCATTDDSFEADLIRLLARNELVAFYSNIGRVDDARRGSEDLLMHANKLFSVQEFPNGHVTLATVSFNAATIFETLGETDKAATLYEYVTNSLAAICQRESQAIDPTMFTSASIYWAKVLIREHRFIEAETRLRSASSILGRFQLDKSYGCDALHDLLTELGRIKRARGSYVEAHDLFRQALEFDTQRQGSGDPGEQFGTAQVLSEVGRTYAAERDFSTAREYYQKSLTIRQALFPKPNFPKGHPSIANTLRDLGIAYLDGDEPDRAFSLLKESVAIEHALGESFAGGTSEAQLLNLASKKFQSLGPLLEAWTRTNRPAEDVYAHVWLRHGFVARVAAGRQRELRDLARDSSPELYGQYLSVRQDLARVLLVSFTDDHEQNQNRRELLQQLNATKEDLERQLTRKFESAEDEQVALADIQSLQRILPNATVFVDFFTCRRRPYDATVPDLADPMGERRLFAFIVDRTRPVQCVELGDADRIGGLAKAWCSSLAPIDGQALRKSVWDPVSVHFPPDTGTVYVAPDEGLVSVAWAALPGQADGHFLLDHYSVALVPYGKFLLEQLLRRSSGRGQHSPLLVVADVDYGGNTFAIADNRDGINDLLWTPLPETRIEAEAIQAHMQSGSVQLLTGAEATLPNVLQHLPDARTLHFATHGFYIDDALISQLELLAAQGPASALTINRSRTSVLARSPFLRSGLVLAGANQQVRLDARGLPNFGGSVLSGEAVMALNAERVELVVLSACDSGRGDLTSGDGSWGIMSAFHAAGARNVVAGLWKVSDQATARLMAEFYRGLGQDGLTPLEALRAAQLALARQPVPLSSDRGVDLGQTVPLSDASANKRQAASLVRNWAGFILSGPGF